uniref:Uncharacterized protein n=1 Tax=Rhizobium rhizogenes TaxID=359 RepID=A0A7S5DRA3_RHIRH|nr:hypothetical protein pC5.7b_415 [Rhizobium rhizogenes]
MLENNMIFLIYKYSNLYNYYITCLSSNFCVSNFPPFKHIY